MLPGALTNTPTPIEHSLSYRKPIQGAPLARRPVGFKGWEREGRPGEAERVRSTGEGGGVPGGEGCGDARGVAEGKRGYTRIYVYVSYSTLCRRCGSCLTPL